MHTVHVSGCCVCHIEWLPMSKDNCGQRLKITFAVTYQRNPLAMVRKLKPRRETRISNRKQAEETRENWKGWEPGRLNPQRQQAVWINVTSAAPWRATEAPRAHPQDRSSRMREKVTAVWGEHLIDPCATGTHRHQIAGLRPHRTFHRPDSLEPCYAKTCLFSYLAWLNTRRLSSEVIHAGCFVISILRK